MQVLNSISYIYCNLHCISFLVICVQCYVGPCGVLVPMGMVHSNNEFEFKFDLYSFNTCWVS